MSNLYEFGRFTPESERKDHLSRSYWVVCENPEKAAAAYEAVRRGQKDRSLPFYGDEATVSFLEEPEKKNEIRINVSEFNAGRRQDIENYLRADELIGTIRVYGEKGKQDLPDKPMDLPRAA